MKYVGDISDAICDIKRLYADLIIVRPCPNCGKNVELDYNQNYISYGGDDNLNFYCYDGCKYEWKIKANITATIIIETKE